MGDRTFVSVEVLEKDSARFQEILGEGIEPCEPDQGFVLFEVPEANWGAQDEIHEAAEAGLTFHGFHGEGDNYPMMEFASHAGEFREVISAKDVGPVVRVDEDGNPWPSDIDHARAYCALVKRIKSLRTP